MCSYWEHSLFLDVIKITIPAQAKAAIVVVQVIKECQVTKQLAMKSTPDRDLLVLFRNEFMSQQAIDQEVDCLNKILRHTDLPNEFCKAHELVRRNRITQKAEKLLEAFRQPLLKPFWFLISKN